MDEVPPVDAPKDDEQSQGSGTRPFPIPWRAPGHEPPRLELVPLPAVGVGRERTKPYPVPDSGSRDAEALGEPSEGSFPPG